LNRIQELEKEMVVNPGLIQNVLQIANNAQHIQNKALISKEILINVFPTEEIILNL